MDFIVVLEPSRQQSDYGLSIRQDRRPSIIAFEGFDECLRDAVGFWRADWRETKLEAQGGCGFERVLGDVRRAVVGQPFDGMRRLADSESTLDASYHQVACAADHAGQQIDARTAYRPPARVPMPYRATLPVRSKRGAVHTRFLENLDFHGLAAEQALQ